jgi:FHS family L-fucose permease-like MFS transporter
MNHTTTQPSNVSVGSNPYARPLVFITSLFFVFGFLTCMNDILIPHLKSQFTLNYTQALLVQFAFFSSYFFCFYSGFKIL